ncbi:hypothetical protein COW36_12755 [bacterium (Candidatus Blackallbacteria) CG17_big_fil_post_rev_8_21_14_2_50_48_46]|uniref:Uncharacterized protein n=1 Tax=bacterium (Candidatus Blackallbacteria) CG17_big_fil_post_rev_8_21_14_2_50_48_46 TaxID=2014261 RepID=A0A2M7G4F8_9BACT|nr:MAG: hypothetical protein COW64_02510 [bacterium (Candidatus Blackallbacteria) CG18_big_fil_WC_8_21_14_2_50_49_26]PIW16631.1 MAG: hypothetical protein COW36_12755 [bacterium (Candidatus Blackallbacteria) CG17_big_fil_post_rev_8_21_14_2_50_48_46]PIW46138.1 MAG: hypothetical protein COW20_18015 [bacterium (Candidatus Blackallbacteria) CG13_big_fil_rev_8_21_14_2_50_49_14]
MKATTLFLGGILGLFCISTSACSLQWSNFQGINLSKGSASSQVANGTIKISWERSADNILKITGQLNFKLEKLYLQLKRNQTLLHQETVTPQADGSFSAQIADPQFAQELCIETACFAL